MIIDFHTHAFPDSLAERAISHLKEKAISNLEEKANIKAYHNGTVSDLINKMDKWNVDKAVVLSIATNPTQQVNVNNFAISLLSNDRIIPFGSVFPGSSEVESELVRIKNAGIKGIKLHSEYQSFYFDDPIAFPIYEICAELGLIVQFHSGFDIGFIQSGDFANTRRIRNVLSIFPETTFIAAHFGAYDMWHYVCDDLCGFENLYIDTSMSNSIAKIDSELALNIIEKHGYEKILLGSDMPWQETSVSIDFIKSLNLPKEQEEAILGKNAMNLLSVQ